MANLIAQLKACAIQLPVASEYFGFLGILCYSVVASQKYYYHVAPADYLPQLLSNLLF